MSVTDGYETPDFTDQIASVVLTDDISDQGRHTPPGVYRLSAYRIGVIASAYRSGPWQIRPLAELRLAIEGVPVGLGVDFALTANEAFDVGQRLIEASKESATQRSLMRWLIAEHGGAEAGAAYARYVAFMKTERMLAGVDYQEATHDEHEGQPGDEGQQGQEGGSEPPGGAAAAAGPDTTG